MRRSMDPYRVSPEGPGSDWCNYLEIMGQKLVGGLRGQENSCLAKL